MTRLALIFLLTILPAACALIPQSTKDQAVSLAGKVCTTLTPAERQILRDEINANLNPKQIGWCGIKCPGEPPPVVPACK